MSETLMTEAATTTEGQSASVVADPAAQATANAQQVGNTEQQATGEQTGQQSVEGEKPNADEADKQAEGEGEQKADAPKAPEKYEFKAPEGQEFDATLIAEFSDVARELDLPQDAAQKLLDKMAPVMQARQVEAIEAIKKQWVDNATVDKEFGGDKLTENLAVAKKALDKFGTPELRTLLNETGLGNNPEIIRAFYRAGKAISEDSFVGGGSGNKAVNSDPAKSLYPNQP